MFYCGIDITKNSYEASIIDARGKLLTESISFSNSQKGCEELFKSFERFEIIPENVVIGMEATGHYWLSIYSFFIKNNFNTKVINSIQSEAFRNIYIQQTKNELKESFVIAQITRFGQYSETKLTDEKVIALRQLSRYRFSFVVFGSNCKRRVITLLDQVFPEYQRFFSDTFGVSSKEILLKYPTPEDIFAISTSELSKIFEKASNGHFELEKAKNLKSIAETSFSLSFTKDAFSFQIKQLIQQIIFIENQIEDLEKQISILLSKTNQLITTIPGIGEILGAIIVSEIGDIHRFDSPSKLVAFAGLGVKVSQPDEFLDTKNKISKRCSPYLRRAIWLAASRAAFCDPILSSYYQSLKSRGKNHLTAIGAVARKLCNIIFVILRENRPYQLISPLNLKI